MKEWIKYLCIYICIFEYITESVKFWFFLVHVKLLKAFAFLCYNKFFLTTIMIAYGWWREYTDFFGHLSTFHILFQWQIMLLQISLCTYFHNFWEISCADISKVKFLIQRCKQFKINTLLPSLLGYSEFECMLNVCSSTVIGLTAFFCFFFFHFRICICTNSNTLGVLFRQVWIHVTV